MSKHRCYTDNLGLDSVDTPATTINFTCSSSQYTLQYNLQYRVIRFMIIIKDDTAVKFHILLLCLSTEVLSNNQYSPKIHPSPVLSGPASVVQLVRKKQPHSRQHNLR